MNKRYIDFVPSNRKVANPATSARIVRKTVQVETPELYLGSDDHIEPVPRRVRRVVRRTQGVQIAHSTRGVIPPVNAVTRSSGAVVQPVDTARSINAVANPARRVVRPAVRRTPAGVTRGVHAASHPSNTHNVTDAPALGVVEDLNSRFVKTDVPKRPLSQAPEPSPAVLAEKAKAKKSRSFMGSKKAGKAVDKSVDKSNEGNQAQTVKTPFINQGKVEKRPLSRNVHTKAKKTVVAPKAEPKGTVAIIDKPKKDSQVGIIITIIITIILGAAAGTVAFLLLPK